MQQCLNRERLVAYLAALADDEEAAHVESCPDCRKALEEVPDPGDPFQTAVRASAAEPPLSEVETVILPGDHLHQSPSLPAFDRVGKYELLVPIGHGGLGPHFALIRALSFANRGR